MKHRKTTAAVILVLTMLLDILCLLSLPYEIAVRWNDSGDPIGYISKYHALLIGYIVTLVSLWLWQTLCEKQENSFPSHSSGRPIFRKTAYIITDILGFALSCSGIILSVILLILNERLFTGEFSPLGWGILWASLYFGIQLILCFHVRNRFIKCIPVYLSVTGIIFALCLIFNPSNSIVDVIGAMIVGAIIAYGISGVIAAWLIYLISLTLEKHKEKRKTEKSLS